MYLIINNNKVVFFLKSCNTTERSRADGNGTRKADYETKRRVSGSLEGYFCGQHNNE